jgi:hypothetical protein
VCLLAQNASRRVSASTPNLDDDFARRARALCADLMSIEIDRNIHHLQCKARSLLTGEPFDRLLKSLKEDA